MDPMPIVLISPSGPARDRILASLSHVSVEVLDTVEAFLHRDSGTGSRWGLVLLGPDLPPSHRLDLLEGQCGWPEPWSVLLVREEDEALKVRSLSLGVAQSLEEVAGMAADPEGKGPALELHWVLRVVAMARHDLNNPLTAGLAEVQLLLMDDHGPEVNESLEIIQEQFRRLRDMVAAMARLRVPPKKES